MGTKLINTSFYALIRHPGFYFLALLLASIILISRSKLLLIASLLWEPLDLTLIFLDDTYTYRRMFPDYDQYRRETPMLFPSRKSLRHFLDSIGKRTKV
jgi:protein-S-isoprenylcysteine O-methyltransferase Ste14